MKTSICFKRSYSLIVAYSRSVTNYFEIKYDIYSLHDLPIHETLLLRRTIVCFGVNLRSTQYLMTDPWAATS